MANESPSEPEVDGFVLDQRLEAVAALARTSAVSAGGGALCVYLDGVPVVDVWAGSRDPSRGMPWEHEHDGDVVVDDEGDHLDRLAHAR